VINLTDSQKRLVKQICHEYLPESKIMVFGSRARGEGKTYSDLDLAVSGNKELSLESKALLIDAFQNSDLPFRVEIVDLAEVEDSFKKIISIDLVQI
jgi:uncharacterized protein